MSSEVAAGSQTHWFEELCQTREISSDEQVETYRWLRDKCESGFDVRPGAMEFYNFFEDVTRAYRRRRPVRVSWPRVVKIFSNLCRTIFGLDGVVVPTDQHVGEFNSCFYELTRIIGALRTDVEVRNDVDDLGDCDGDGDGDDGEDDDDDPEVARQYQRAAVVRPRGRLRELQTNDLWEVMCQVLKKGFNIIDAPMRYVLRGLAARSAWLFASCLILFVAQVGQDAHDQGARDHVRRARHHVNRRHVPPQRRAAGAHRQPEQGRGFAGVQDHRIQADCGRDQEV